MILFHLIKENHTIVNPSLNFIDSIVSYTIEDYIYLGLRI